MSRRTFATVVVAVSCSAAAALVAGSSGDTPQGGVARVPERIVSTAVPGSAQQSDAVSGTVRRKVTLVTYMNEVSNLFGFLQVTAAQEGLHPRILGYGDKAWWPDGLGAKINALRHFVHSEVEDDELVLFVDAFDVLVLGGREEVVSKFEALEREQKRSLFFNAERVCFPDFPDICTEDYPVSPNSRYRYLNSGAFIGRGAALRAMLADPVNNTMPGSDQAFYQRYFRHNTDKVGLDTGCSLLCATQGIGGSWGVELVGERLQNHITGTIPAVVHFVSNAHWAQWRDGRPTTDLAEVFASLHPEASDNLFKKIEVSMRIGASHKSTLFSLHGRSTDHYHRVMRIVLCFRCRLLGSGGRECEFVPSITCDMCQEVRIWLSFTIFIKVGVFLACFGRHRASLGKRLSRWMAYPPFSWCVGPAALNALRSFSGKVAESAAASKAEKAV